MKIKYTLDNGAFAPEKAHSADAGYDLRAPKDFSLYWDRDEIVIDTGVHVAIPEGYVGFIKSKSGLNTKYGIVSEGVIDSGYTGSIKVRLLRVDKYGKVNTHEFKRGDKITQLVILPIINAELEEAKSLDETERGDNGFGSTGR